MLPSVGFRKYMRSAVNSQKILAGSKLSLAFSYITYKVSLREISVSSRSTMTGKIRNLLTMCFVLKRTSSG